jgi:hypothetical protein
MGMPPVAAPIESVNQETSVLVSQHHKLFLGLWVLSLALMGAVFCFIYFVLGDTAIVSLNANDGSIVAPFIPLLIPLFAYIFFMQKARHLMVAQIGQSLGYSYSKDGSFETVSGVLFSRGHSRKIFDVLIGNYRDYPARIFTYEYTVQEGKHSHTYYSTVCELTYASSLPHIVLLRQELFGLNGDVGLLSGLDFMQKTELEGDFNKYFKLYIEKNADIAVRELLQPDIMQDFISKFTNKDLEIKDSKVYIMQPGQLSTRQDYLALHELADTLIDKLLPSLRSVSEDKTAATQ